MYISFGALQLNVIDGPDEITEDYGHDYAEHAVISGKPQVQTAGASLDRMTIEIHVSDEFSDVDGIYSGLKSMAASGNASPLLFGSGEYLGRYFIETLSITRISSDAQGRLNEFTASISLVEGSSSGGIFGLLLGLLSAPALIVRAVNNIDVKGR